MPIKYLLGHVEQSKDLRITNRVEDAEPVFAGIYNMPCAQNSELLRESALFCVQPGAQIIHSNLSVAQLVHNADAQRVGQGFEEFGLEEPEVGGVLRSHSCLYISILIEINDCRLPLRLQESVCCFWSSRPDAATIPS